jgi:hypothetical protein
MHASQKVSHFLKYLVLTLAFVVLCSLQPKRPCGGSDVVRLRAYQRNYGKLQPLHLTVRPGHVLTSCRHFCTDEGVCRPIKFEQRRLRFLEKFCGEQRVALSGPALLFLKPTRFTLQCSKTANSFEALSQGPIWLDVHRVRMMSGTDSPTAVSQHTRASQVRAKALAISGKVLWRTACCAERPGSAVSQAFALYAAVFENRELF